MRTLRQSLAASVKTKWTWLPRRGFIFLLSGLLFVAGSPAVTLAQGLPIVRANPTDPLAAFIAEASQRFGVPEAWIRAVMRVESAGDVRAISRAGAMGLMQIMPDTWADLRIRHRLGIDPYDPRDNIFAGAAYLREMHDRYGSPGFLAAYNAGPGRYDEYLANGRALPAETRAYVTALAPLVGGAEIRGPFTVAAADPLAWTHAPLFVSRAERTTAADSTPTGTRSADIPGVNPMRDIGASASQFDSLFIARSDSGGLR